uniref:Phosphatidylinositol 5-phosphate 4-kinase type-2 gamma n=1 Tax=Astyanax mexicanus TaxID=7994 RepID=A0A3B1JRG5_ASTMX
KTRKKISQNIRAESQTKHENMMWTNAQLNIRIPGSSSVLKCSSGPHTEEPTGNCPDTPDGQSVPGTAGYQVEQCIQNSCTLYYICFMYIYIYNIYIYIIYIYVHIVQVSLARSPPIRDGSGQDERVLTSYDRTLIIKQISSEEVEDMHHILSEYHQHIVTCHGITLLPQFLGMYRVTVDNEDTYLTVTRSMFSHRLTIHRKYDLKGSLVSREASDKEKVKELPTFKDMDFRNNMQRIYLSDEEKEKLMEKLNRDVEFLVRSKIMDYSLLLGIHDLERAEREEEEEFEESTCEEEEESENGVSAGSPAVVSPSTSPEGIAEYDPYVDVYAIQSAAGAPQREVYFMGLIKHSDTLRHQEESSACSKNRETWGSAEISTFISNIIAY